MAREKTTTILLVEDEAIIAMMERSILERANYQVLHVSTGEKAMELVSDETQSIDLVLMDIDLGPGIDGTETAEQILRYRPVPIVFLSSHTEPDIVEATERITSYGFVVKSTAKSVLLTSIKMALRLFDARAKSAETQKALEISEARYRNLFEHMTEEVHLWEVVRDDDTSIRTWRLVDANPAGLQSWGRDKTEVVGKTADEIWPEFDAVSLFRPIVEKIFSERRAYSWESNFPATGQVLFMTSVPFGEFFLSTGIDITDRKQEEEKSKRQLQEKEALIKEIHHRVKNNINTVESLLTLQADNTDSHIGNDGQTGGRSAIRVAASRVRSIRVLYDRLLVEDDYEEASAAVYIKSIVDAIAHVFQDDTTVALQTEISDIRFSTEKLTEIGMLLNELITNAYRHAFSGRDHGTIVVSLRRDEDSIVLEVQDDGIGMVGDFEDGPSNGCGTTIVRILVEQLNGNLELRRDNGTRVIVRFSEENETYNQAHARQPE